MKSDFEPMLKWIANPDWFIGNSAVKADLEKLFIEGRWMDRPEEREVLLKALDCMKLRDEFAEMQFDKLKKIIDEDLEGKFLNSGETSIRLLEGLERLDRHLSIVYWTVQYGVAVNTHHRSLGPLQAATETERLAAQAAILARPSLYPFWFSGLGWNEKAAEVKTLLPLLVSHLKTEAVLIQADSNYESKFFRGASNLDLVRELLN